MNGDNYEILNIKGVTEHEKEENWGIHSVMLKGNLDLSDSKIDRIAVGLRMALRLACRVGDTIYVSSLNNLQRTYTDFFSIPHVGKFIVSGIFETNNKDYDIQFAYTSLGSAQKILELSNKITGYDIRLHDFDSAFEVKDQLNSSLNGQLFAINTWYDLHKDLYDVMLIERWSAFILLSLIISVATFNIFGSLTMSVIEKIKDIGVLRSMGVRINSVVKIFLFQGLLIGLIGTLSGFIVGITVCYLQMKLKFYALDPSKYIIDSIPVEIRISDIIIICIVTIFLTLIVSIFPARKASKTNILDAIKYE
ncbi:ABC transporter permease [Bacteroidota bacterium]